MAVCDGANESYGKLNLLGAFNRIFATNTPAIHPACTVVSRIQFEASEAGLHEVTIRFVDADGKELFPAVKRQVNAPVDPRSISSTVNMILNVQQLPLPSFGEYSVDLEIDGKHEASHSLLVSMAPLPA